MKTKKSIIFSIFSLLVISAISNGDSGKENSQDWEFEVKTAQEAVSRALEYTGFGTIKSVTIEDAVKSAKITTITDDKTPILHKKINNRSIWRMEFENIHIINPHVMPDTVDKNPRTFVVYIDPVTGRLLKIHSIREGYDTNISPLPPIDFLDEQFSHPTGEVYIDFPIEPPMVKFFEALKHTDENAMLAGEIIGVYVLTSEMGSLPHAVWAIDLRGLPPYPTPSHHGKNVPEYQRNHLRTVSDAKSGNRIFSDTRPQVRYKPEDMKRIQENKNNK